MSTVGVHRPGPASGRGPLNYSCRISAESADLVLRLPGSTEELVATAPIGAYVPAGTCALTVDLVHAVRPQG